MRRHSSLGRAAARVVAFGLAGGVLARAEGLAPSLVDPYVARPRVVVMTDIANEPDDQMSLVRFLLYSNQWDVEGLVASTSTWMKSRVRPDVILSVLDAYEKVQPNLLKHAPGFPAAAALRAVVTPGQPGYGMAAVGEGKTSPGADLILRAAERDDRRPLWVLAWGGTNTLAQALSSARSTRTPAQLEAVVSKLRVYAISDQDDAGPWIRREFPGLRYVATPSTQDGEEYSFATWTGISGDRSGDRRAAAGGHRPRDPGRRGRRDAEPDVVPARHPEDEAGGGDGAYSTVNATERLAIAFALWSVTVTRSS